MKTHTHLSVALVALFLNLAGPSLHAAPPDPVKKVSSFLDIIYDIPSYDRTLVLLDIDNCCICPEGYEGSFGQAVDNVKTLVKQTTEALKSNKHTLDLEAIKSQSAALAYEMFARAQHNIVMKTTDAWVFPFFQHLKMQSVPPTVIGFTSRRSREADLTIKQLESQALYLNPISDFEFKEEAVISGFDCVAEYDPRGILFCGELNTKGYVFKKFIEKLHQEGFLKKIDRILYVDDTQDQLESVGQAFESMHLEMTLQRYHYQFPIQVRPPAARDASLDP